MRKLCDVKAHTLFVCGLQEPIPGKKDIWWVSGQVKALQTGHDQGKSCSGPQNTQKEKELKRPDLANAESSWMHRRLS